MEAQHTMLNALIDVYQQSKVEHGWFTTCPSAICWVLHQYCLHIRKVSIAKSVLQVTAWLDRVWTQFLNFRDPEGRIHESSNSDQGTGCPSRRRTWRGLVYRRKDANRPRLLEESCLHIVTFKFPFLGMTMRGCFFEVKPQVCQLRALCTKIKSYCLRFRTVLTRLEGEQISLLLQLLKLYSFFGGAGSTWVLFIWSKSEGRKPWHRTYKYDEGQLEFFIQTSEKVKIKRSDLDKVISAEALDPEAFECCESLRLVKSTCPNKMINQMHVSQE